jgi:N-acetylmuramic acid 6-phosphate (MurNAc-6-P) etherase
MTRISTDKKRRALPVRLPVILGTLLFLSGLPALLPAAAQEPPAAPARAGLLQLLGLEASPESIDYVQNKTQFQLHTLLTEQRHPKTWNLSERLQKDVSDGLRMLLSVDDDITERLEALASDSGPLESLVAALEQAVLDKKRIYIYGCGATGRLAKQMESSFWRPFWREIKADGRIWPKLKPRLSPEIEDDLIGEMTGADRALISSLEGFEDLPLIGRLQLADRGIRRGDTVVCVTEGGETSSVIGTILAALDQWKVNGVYDPDETRKKLFFVYNNPDDRLLPFARSRRVIEEPGITRINLTTGPQAITGSTRMQATTIETFVIGCALEESLARVLGRALSPKELARAGFMPGATVRERLLGFRSVLDEVRRNIPAIAALTTLESDTYGAGRFSTYLAGHSLITVFIDSTERSPTFRLFPLDTTAETERKCWIQVWTPAASLEEAWRSFLGRPFRGLTPDLYRKPFEEEIEDPYLKKAALESLKKAGNDQQFLYDFSFSDANVRRRGPRKGDLGLLIMTGSEAESLARPASPFRRFLELCQGSGSSLGLIIAGAGPGGKPPALPAEASGPPSILLNIPADNDPFGLRREVGLKMLLNAHSTAVMTRLGRVIGNTMTNVSPSNLKLIGRATFLIQSHVNDFLSRPTWLRLHGRHDPITYGEANAVLFDAIAFLKDKKETAGQTAEVALSIIRILESLRQMRGLTNDEALEILLKVGLDKYLSVVD